MHSAMILNVDPTELKFAIHFVGMLLIHACMSKINVVSSQTCHF